MAVPIEMVRGDERQTVYSAHKEAIAIADGWQRVSDLTPAAQEKLAAHRPEPFAGFDALTVEAVLIETDGMDFAQRSAVLEYERATKNRKTIVNALGGTWQS